VYPCFIAHQKVVEHPSFLFSPKLGVKSNAAW
jgi:hypothetical protein